MSKNPLPTSYQQSSPPLVVIVGQTASGKSALGMQLAQKFDGEIICADARTVYRGMDIGTAKPTKKNRATARHHMLDIAAPDKQFTAAEFKKRANNIIHDIHKRNKLPIMVGGTGLYIDSVIFDYKFPPKGDTTLRGELAKLSVEALQEEVLKREIELPLNERNPRHLIRAIETGGVATARSELRSNTLVIGLQLAREELHQRISQRVDEMVQAGFEDEVRDLLEKYGYGAEALQAPGYKAFAEYIAGHISSEEARALFIRNDMQLAKRQRTWFKRNKSIHWLSDPKQAVDIVTTFLNKLQ